MNDRFALDGLSPPSYGGVLWCFGWQDKPAAGQKVSEKWAYRYRTGANGFLQAKESLYDYDYNRTGSVSFVTNTPVMNGKRTIIKSTSTSSSPAVAKKARRDDEKASKSSSSKSSILSYFSPKVGPQRKIG